MSPALAAIPKPRAQGSIGVAIVGFGTAGHQHLSALSQVDLLEAVAFVEEGAPGEAELPRASLEQVLASPAIGLVAVCVPPGSRPLVMREVIHAGKSMVVEKPAFGRLADLDATDRAAAEAGSVVGVMHQHRFALPGAVERLRWSGRARASLVVSRPRRDEWFTGWRADPSQSLGGITAHLGVHYLDLACQLLGEPVAVEVMCRRDRAPGVDSRMELTVQFEAGAVLRAVVTGDSDHRCERLLVADQGQKVDVLDGQVRLRVGARSSRWPARSAAALRAEVYREVASACGGATGPLMCGLARTRGVTAILERLYGDRA